MPSKEDSRLGDDSGMESLSPEDIQMIAGSSPTNYNPPPGPPIPVIGHNPPAPPPPPPPNPPTNSPPSGGGGGGGQDDPYSSDFDCSAASPADKQLHNRLTAMHAAENAIRANGFGTNGIDHKEFGYFVYQTADGAYHLSNQLAGNDSTLTGFTYGRSSSSVPAGHFDQIVIGAQTIPTSQIVAFVHNHPDATASGNLAEYPLPSTTEYTSQPGGGEIRSGDWGLMQDLVQNGADPNTFMLGILAMPSENGSYGLYTYTWAEDPPYNPNDPSTWAPAYGPIVPEGMTPCP